MRAKAKKTVVKVGVVSIPVYPMRDGRFVVKHKEDGKWKNIACPTLDDAKQKAEAVARRLQNGESTLMDLSPVESNILARARRLKITHAELDKIEQLRGSAKPVFLQDAVDTYIAAKVAKRSGRKGVYVRPLEQDLKKFQEFVGNIAVQEILPKHIDEWMAAKMQEGVGERRRLNLYKVVRGFLIWCKRTGMIGDELPIAEESKPVVRTKLVDIYAPDEWKNLLNFAWSRDEFFLLWLAFCGFSGCRSQEIMPSKKCEKPGMRWEYVRWSEDVIVVPGEVAKTGFRRIMPILPAFKAWVYPYRKDEGVIIPTGEWHRVRAFVSEAGEAGVKVIRNGARHSYGSYRTAEVKSAGQVALEMGNSEIVVKRHYLYHVTPVQAKAWWKIRPKRGRFGSDLVQAPSKP